MTNKLLLFPYRFKRIGWIILIPAAIIGIMMWFDGFEGIPSYLLPEAFNYCSADNQYYNLCHGETITRVLNNIALIGILIGTTLVCCSREKVEDEMIGIIRLNSLLAAFYANTTAVCLAALFIYDLTFLEVMLCELIALPVLFTVIFRIRLYMLKKDSDNEK